MKVAVMDAQGKELRKLDVDETVFGITPNIPVLHQAYVTQRANMRGGNHKTKTRGEVQGSTRKIRKQKYTGSARAGSIRAPNRVGGGIVFGPRPHSYAKDLPKKMRRLAIRSALSGKLADGQLVIIDQLAMEKPKTKEMIRLLNVIGFERSALVVTGSSDRMVIASVANLDKTKTMPAAYLNVVDMMNYAGLLMTEEAVRVAEKLWGKKETENGVRLAARQKLVIEEKPKGPSRASRARMEGEPEATKATKAEREEAPTGRKTKFVPKAEVEAEAPVAEVEAEAPAAEPVAEAPAAKPEARAEPEAKPARAPKPEAATEAIAETTEEAPKPAARRKKAEATTETTDAPKPAARRKKAEPKAEGDAPEGEAKPKRAPRAKAAKPAAEGGEEAPKPKRAPRAKKTEEGK
jgi:large subunit ribosomal protein L4